MRGNNKLLDSLKHLKFLKYLEISNLFFSFSFFVITFTILFLKVRETTYSEVKIKLLEEIKFENLNTQGTSLIEVIGIGKLEVSTDSLEEDMGKVLVFKFPQSAVMSNRKKQIVLKDISLSFQGKNSREGRNIKNEMVVTKNYEIIEIYLTLNKNQLLSEESPDVVEGEYIGDILFEVEEYGKKEMIKEEIKTDGDEEKR